MRFTLVEAEPRERQRERADRPASSRQTGEAAKPKPPGRAKPDGGQAGAAGTGRGGNRPEGSPTAKRSAESGAATPEGAGAAGSATPTPAPTPGSDQTVLEGDRESAGSDEDQQPRWFVIGPISITTER